MKSFRQRAIDGLKTGDRFTLSRCFSQEDIECFAKISRDYNPVHFDQSFALARQFRGPVSHGLLTASLITEIGGQIGWLASSMTFNFKRPVYPGQTVTCDWLITDVDERDRATATIILTDEDGAVVLEGETRGVLPGLKEREIMLRMMIESDSPHPM
ncbi:MaoC family dehydratase [Pseudomonas sp. NPDC087346]|uniref:MaoC family dehydratase n=1 Tax=Pseudomonas sp. NPDC087346 TaxID=3364438 RepID=UPI00382DF712